MKKLTIIFTILIAIITGISFFVSSNYFFNKYIAKNIKEYGFNYTHVNGAVFRGFVIEGLSYKNKLLSSNVELRISPIRLLRGKLLVKKLHLIGVRKDTLDNILSDFKSENNDSSSKVNLLFEIRDILLTLKPFKIDNIDVKRASISIEYLEFDGNKFSVGDVEYSSKTNYGNFSFKGKYFKRVLNIDNIRVEKLALDKVIALLKSLKESNRSDNNSSDLLNSPFVPKKIIVNKAKLNINSFKFRALNIESFNLSVKKLLFDVDNLVFNSANINTIYNSKEANFKINIKYKNSNINVENLDLNITEPNKIEAIVKQLIVFVNSGKSNNASTNIVPINRIKVDKSNININNYELSTETIKEAILKIRGLEFQNNSLKLKSFYTDINLTSSNIILNGNIDNNITFELLKIKSKNLDNLFSLIPKSNSSESNTTNPFKNIHNIVANKLIIEGDKLTFKPYIIYNGELNATKVIYNLVNSKIDSQRVLVNVNSNWGKAYLDGRIRDNNYYAKGGCEVTQTLFDEFNLPLIAKNLNKFKVNGRFGLKSLDLNTTLSGDNILKKLDGISIKKSINSVSYNYYNNDVIWKIDANIETKYIGKAKLKNRLEYIKDRLNYNGKLILKENILKNSQLSKLLSNLIVNYSGNSNQLVANLTTNFLKGKFITKDFKKGKINISNIDTVKLNNFLTLTDTLNRVIITKLNIKSNLNFNNLFPLKGNIDLKSNIINLNGIWEYGNNFKSFLEMRLSKNSILFQGIKGIKYNNIKTFKTNIELSKELKLKVKNNLIDVNINYSFESKKVNSKIKLDSILTKITGNIKSLKLNIKTNSILKALKSINKIYNIEKSEIDGILNCDIKIVNLSNISYLITSPKLIYDLKNRQYINDLSIEGTYENSNLYINRYSFVFNDYNIYSTKQSIVTIKDDTLYIKSFWINDSLNMIGKYSLNSSTGKVSLRSNSFKLSSQQGKVTLSIDSNIDINRDKKSISGKINIINGIIKNLNRKNIAENKDIIILQRKKAKESTSFAKNIKLNILIKSTNAIIYSEKGSYFKLIPDIKVDKNYGSLSNIKGIIKITKDSYYNLNGKKLKVVKGFITFKGKSSSPNINVDLVYRGKDYTIYINVSGTPTRPILYFTSNPSLNKEEILAYLLFDDIGAVGTHSQESMLNMIGGSLAKSLLGSIGIKVDHFSIKENGFSVGKKIGKNIMIYYNQEQEASSIKTRIDITNSIHTEIEVGKDKQSADIIFSKEY